MTSCSADFVCQLEASFSAGQDTMADLKDLLLPLVPLVLFFSPASRA